MDNLVPLPNLAKDVLGLYEKLLFDEIAKQTSSADSEKLLEQFGRLKIWMEQTGATKENTNSLQETLQNDQALQTSVAGALQQLRRLVSAAIAMSPDLDGSSLTSDSEYSTDSQQQQQGSPNLRPRVSRFSLVLSHIFEQIDLLYYYSTIFRRPRLRGRYLHSKAEEDQGGEVPYYEYSHVHQKLNGWSPTDLSSEIGRLCWRLATANTRRREQLRYWAGHPYDEEHEKGPQSPVDSKAEPSRSAPSETATRRSHPATVNTFSSIARSAIYDTEIQVGPSRTVYSQSDFGIDRGSLIRVPKVPIPPHNSTKFECPFCKMVLRCDHMKERDAWKRHVFRDLRPYVCTFTQCSNPEKLYATRREWIYHEMQMHRRQWNCRPCNTSYPTKELMALHVRSIHEQLSDYRQLSAVLQVSEAPIDGGQEESCPFCKTQLPLSALMGHIAGHLEQLALFALPLGNEDTPASPSSGALSSLDSVANDTPLVEPTPLTPDTSAERTDLSGNYPKTLTCDECGRVFDQIHKLSHHKRYHERPHECPHPGCVQRFGTKTHLDRHINDKHMRSRAFHCTIPDCPYSRQGGQSFPRKDNWKRHMILKHGVHRDGYPDSENMELHGEME
ncbi:hypothetical protein QBC43DRAFT_300476 [Cladorrhinum sp. PSN259]|nr:hypothetical protein QBC43DRAFT_300476 [Cladorrhinum sp. PSN259]